MARFRVWAPRADSMSLKLGERTLPMTAGQRGWWELEAEAAHGSDYAYLINGEEPALPDPRSLWQPQGLHGPSRRYDHSRFFWEDERWQAVPLASAVIYELHIGAFTPEGTFEAAIPYLDHLADLGITHVEIMPVAEFPGRAGWGYDGAVPFAVHGAYGGPDGLKAFVNACHLRGLAVILDVVYNHLGPDGNYLGSFGPYFTDRYSTPWGEAINFDGRDSDEVRRFFLDNALMWLRDYHVDGLRLDAVHAIIDLSAVHFLEELAEEVDALQTRLGKYKVLIAESDLNDPRLVRSREAGGYGLDAQWNDDFRHSLHSILTGERNGFIGDFGTFADLATALEETFVYSGRYSRYRGRRHGRPAGGVPGHRFLGYLQNHDQVGNRARGERSSALMSEGRLKAAAALVLTAPFVPMLFMGEEWGASTPFQYFTDHQNDELAQSVREGRLQEFADFGWEPEELPDPQAPETAQNSKLRWEEREREPHAGILAWHRELIRLRRRLPALSAGWFDPVKVYWDEERRWLVMERGALTVACNLGEGEQVVPWGGARRSEILLASDPGIQMKAEGVLLPPDSSAILG